MIGIVYINIDWEKVSMIGIYIISWEKVLPIGVYINSWEKVSMIGSIYTPNHWEKVSHDWDYIYSQSVGSKYR